MSVALLPIGLMAVFQTQRVASQARVNAELALAALTERAVVEERRALRRAMGAAEALAVAVPDLRGDDAACSAFMANFVERSEVFSFAGYIPPSRVMTCSSSGRTFDFNGQARGADAIANPRPQLTINRAAPLSGTSVITASQPVFEGPDDAFSGYVSISVPHSALAPRTEDPRTEALLELVSFNVDGDLLSASGEAEAVETLLPADLALIDLIGTGPEAITARDATGTTRIYTVAPVEEGLYYVLGIWDAGVSVARQSEGEILTSLFPALMWIVSLLVLLFAVDRLVIRHLQRLGGQMALFAAARRLPPDGDPGDPPTEILRIQRAFHAMTDTLLRDEASLENAVREKSVLVKEIHHRVKNNLQLISSIINLQIRDSASPETKAALRRTQERVLGMATIHRDLYQTNESGLVNVGHLIREVVTKSVEVSPEHEDVDLSLEVDDVWLYPDQAVPMSLLASEGVINALKHMPAPGEADRWLRVTLAQDASRTCRFAIANGHRAEGKSLQRAGGMGRRLIRAFATQLDATVRTRDPDGQFRLEIEFQASDFAPAPGTF